MMYKVRLCVALRLNLMYAYDTVFGSLVEDEICCRWDEELNKLIDNHHEDAVFSRRDRIKLGDKEVCIKYQFSNFGSDPEDYTIKLPKRKTAVKLASLLEDLDKKFNTLKF